jgi:gliding motility-associated-like protein
LAKDATSYTDQPGETSGKIWQYKVSGTNLCQRGIESDFHNTIRLFGSADNAAETSNLVWNPYIGWVDAPKYTVLRGFDENSLSDYETGIEASPLPNAKFKNAGDAFVQWYRVVAINPDGRLSYSNKVKLDFENKLDFYNLITPNGDGANDGFVIKNLDLYPENELVITNRWGQEVLSQKNYSNANPWNGGDLQDGVYFYKFTATLKNFATQGWIEIKRQ